MKKLLVGCFICVFASPVLACESGHWVKSKSMDGKIVVLENGTVWQINPINTIDSALWLPTENIIICNGMLINSDTGDKVGAKLLR